MPFFGKSAAKPDAKEVAKAGSRTIRTEQRNLQREERKLERDMAAVAVRLKAAAKKGDQHAVKSLATQYNQLKHTRERMQKASGQLNAVDGKIKSAAASSSVHTAMASAASALAAANQMAGPIPQHIRDFAMAHEKMTVTEEMMDDALADMYGDDESEEDELVSKVLEEIGLETGNMMPSAPGHAAVAAPADPEAEPSQAEIDATVARLLAEA